MPPSYARPPSRISIASSGNMPGTRRRQACRAPGSLVGSSAAVAVLIGDDQVEVPPVAKRAIAMRLPIAVRLFGSIAEAVGVELLDRHVLDGGRIEALERSARAGARAPG